VDQQNKKGDIRKLKVVNIPEYHHLVDCIVFSCSTRDRSESSKMAGGDLDGDQFMVIFDPDLIAKQIYEPYEYPAAKPAIHRERLTTSDMIRYFSSYSNASLGRCNNLYLKWVEAKGAASAEAVELNALFSSCVDGEAINIPARLVDVPQLPEERPLFVLDVLKEAAEEHVKKLLEAGKSVSPMQLTPGPSSDDGTSTLELLEAIIFSKCSPEGLSHFGLIQMIYRLSKRWGPHHPRHQDLMDLLYGIDFATFTWAQKKWTMMQFPQQMKADLLMNALMQSDFLDPDHRLQISKYGNWKRFFTTLNESPEMSGRVLDALFKFKRKILVLEAHERITVSIVFQQDLRLGVNELDALDIFATNRHGFKSHTILQKGAYLLNDAGV
jgi:regulator of nonsense transcripts 1